MHNTNYSYAVWSLFGRCCTIASLWLWHCCSVCIRVPDRGMKLSMLVASHCGDWPLRKARVVGPPRLWVTTWARAELLATVDSIRALSLL